MASPTAYSRYLGLSRSGWIAGDANHKNHPSFGNLISNIAG